jgi:hypothetical protein
LLVFFAHSSSGLVFATLMDRRVHSLRKSTTPSSIRQKIPRKIFWSFAKLFFTKAL